jgi:hypothetical protein
MLLVLIVRVIDTTSYHMQKEEDVLLFINQQLRLAEKYRESIFLLLVVKKLLYSYWAILLFFIFIAIFHSLK